MSGLTFEKLKPEQITQADFERIVQLEADCGLPDPYPPSLIAELLEALDAFVCRIDGSITGFLMITGNGRYFGGSVYIVNINVAKEHRGQNIAKRLILEACRYYLPLRGSRLMSLDVSLDNPALRLYKKIGFKRTIFPSRNGKTDIVMAAPLVSVLQTLERLL